MNVCTSMRTVFPLLLAASALFAQPPGRPEGGFMRFHPVLSTLDADHDGTISAAELNRAPQALAGLDQNKDGQLSAEEMRPRFVGPGGPGARGPGEGRREGGGPRGNDGAAMADQLMQFDKNSDGVLTKDEVPERMQGLFARADANKDGKLTREELTQRANAAPAEPQGRGAGGDHDHEGERRGGPRGGFRDPIMTALDANQDGAVDAAEMKNAKAALAKLDKNGDGQLTEDEVRPQMPFGRPGGRRPEGREERF